jgi:ABC-type branched-subunit amino acid transport system substrate-binding protein
MKGPRFTGARIAAATALGIALVGTLVAFSGGAAASPSARSAASKLCSNIPAGPIKIGDIIPETGAEGVGNREGTEMKISVDYLDAHGGICGHQIAYSLYDDKSDPALSLSLARQLVSGGYTILINDGLNTTEFADGPYVMKSGVLVINPSGNYAYYGMPAHPTGYSIAASNAAYAQLMVNWAKASHDNNIGILSDGTDFGNEMAGNAVADVKAAGLKYIKTVTYSPTAIDLTTEEAELRQAGVKTLFYTGYTGLPAMVSGLKQIAWAPKIVGWGGLIDFEIPASAVPPGTVDGCEYSYRRGVPLASQLTSVQTTLLKAYEAAEGLNSGTGGILEGYAQLQVIAYAVEKANSLNGVKLAAVLHKTSNLPTTFVAQNWTLTPNIHNGFPPSDIHECLLSPVGPYDIPLRASNQISGAGGLSASDGGLLNKDGLNSQGKLPSH